MGIRGQGSGVRGQGLGVRDQGLIRNSGPISHTFLILLFMVILAGCDIIEGPFLENTDDNGQALQNPQKVLVVEYTGHTCKSCPKAHKTVHILQDLYPGRVIPVAFHLGYFARTQTGDKFTTDFRTPEGGLLENYYEFNSFPTGTVQNLRSDGLIPHGQWPSAVLAFMDGNSPIKIEIDPDYLAGLNAVEMNIKATALAPVTGTLKITAYLLEDGVIDWQKDEDFDPMDIPDYEHMHVFRTSACGFWGQLLNDSTAVEKDFVFESTRYIMLQSNWQPANCSVVGIVYRDEDKQIIQVEAHKLHGI